MLHTLETLRRVLRRAIRDRFVTEALRMIDAGTFPPVELLRRCGIRTAGALVLA